MSEYNWFCLEKHKEDINKHAPDLSISWTVEKTDKNGCVQLPDMLQTAIISQSGGIRQVLCFFDDDFSILEYPHRITCIHPQHTPMLRYLLEQNPDKRFRGEIDDAYRLRLPIDSLHKIRIVREVCVSIIDNFSWSIMAVEQEKLFCDIYRNKLNTGEISVPKELLDDYKNTDG